VIRGLIGDAAADKDPWEKSPQQQAEEKAW
jgi:hypothetical protein